MKTSNSVVAEEEGHEFLDYLYNNLQLLQFILKGLLITQHRSSTAFVTNTFVRNALLNSRVYHHALQDQN